MRNPADDTAQLTALLAEADVMDYAERLLALIRELSVRDDDLARGFPGEGLPLSHLEDAFRGLLASRVGMDAAEVIREITLDGESVAYCVTRMRDELAAEDRIAAEQAAQYGA
jgi:hypothetical protein